MRGACLGYHPALLRATLVRCSGDTPATREVPASVILREISIKYRVILGLALLSASLLFRKSQHFKITTPFFLSLS